MITISHEEILSLGQKFGIVREGHDIVCAELGIKINSAVFISRIRKKYQTMPLEDAIKNCLNELKTR